MQTCASSVVQFKLAPSAKSLDSYPIFYTTQDCTSLWPMSTIVSLSLFILIYINLYRPAPLSNNLLQLDYFQVIQLKSEVFSILTNLPNSLQFLNHIGAKISLVMEQSALHFVQNSPRIEFQTFHTLWPC